MALECRLCGKLKQPEELIINIQDEQENVKFSSLVEFFCRVDLAKDPSLSQLACKSCKYSVELFTPFCDQIRSHQLKLHRQYELKKELASSEALKGAKDKVVRKLCQHSPQDCDADDINCCNNYVAGDMFDTTITESNEDTASIVNDYAESTASNSNSVKSVNLRKKIIPTTKECSVSIERLEISYQKTDTEDELDSSDDDDDEFDPNATLKLDTSSDQQSPSKRMKLACPQERIAAPGPATLPVPFKKEREYPETIVKLETKDLFTDCSTNHSSTYERHKSLFPSEWEENYEDSNTNLPVPKRFKAEDGSILDVYSGYFSVWSSLQLQCTIKTCNKLTLKPQEMLVHSKTIHPHQNNLVKCSNCGPSSSTLYNYISYMQHMIDVHCRLLRLCCFGCSTMFFNVTALFKHYKSCRSAALLGEICMCLLDGNVFEDMSKLESHVLNHKRQAKIKHEKDEKGSVKLLIPVSPVIQEPTNLHISNDNL